MRRRGANGAGSGPFNMPSTGGVRLCSVFFAYDRESAGVPVLFSACYPHVTVSLPED